MPKVGKREIRSGKKTATFDLYYGKDGFYLKGFPNSFIDTVTSVDGSDVWPPYFSTESELISAAEKIMRRYYEITTTTKRVILLKVGYGSCITMKKTSIGGYSGRMDRNCADIGTGRFGKDGVSLEWGVAFEWSVKSLVSGSKETLFEIILNDNYEEIERSKYGSEYHIGDGYLIEWTPERHEFFKSMERAMDALADKMIGFFKDKDKMIQLIDTKGFKLLNG